MIQYDPHSWFKLIFNRDSKAIFKQLWPPMLMLLVYTTVLVYVFNRFFDFHWPGDNAIHSLLGVVLGLFLVFRTNTAYDRWWEGRKKWGELVNCCRNLAAKFKTSLPANAKAEHELMAKLIGNFVFAMKEHLREGVIMEEIDPISEEFDAVFKDRDHKPLAVVEELYRRLNQYKEEGLIKKENLWIIDQELKELMDIIGACERIKNTPIPYSYNMFIKKFIFIYTVTLPFGILNITHYWTIPITVIIFYLLVSTELIAEEIEDPFGKDENDLPTDGLSVKIKANVFEVLVGEK